MAIEPTPHITRAGKYLVYGFAAFVGIVLLGLMVQACARQPRVVVAERWTTGYETPQGYMEPDHGVVYYWLLTRVLARDAAPSYHVYVPPPNYPAHYRPWQDDSAYRPRYVPPPDTAPAPTRRSGGFSTTPDATSPAGPTRHDGGFSQPATVTRPTRESGGFSTTPQKAAPADRTPATRTSGGFSGSKATPAPKAAPAAPTRSSGGFSDKTATKPKK